VAWTLSRLYRLIVLPDCTAFVLPVQTDDLARMYIFSRITRGLDPIAGFFKEH
jgi:hypothetical protein